MPKPQINHVRFPVLRQYTAISACFGPNLISTQQSDVCQNGARITGLSSAVLDAAPGGTSQHVSFGNCFRVRVFGKSVFADFQLRDCS